jgi:hypothetical protein
MSGFNVALHGFAEFDRALADNPDRVMVAGGGALYRKAWQIMGRSKEEFVPVDLGILKDSGDVALPEIDGNAMVVEMGYGGAAAAYALKQHEDLTLNHPNGGEAKFLEKPLLEEVPNIVPDVAADMKAELGL